MSNNKIITVTNLHKQFMMVYPKYTVIYGGRGAGKTSILQEILRRISTMSGGLSTLTSANYKYIKQNIIPQIFEISAMFGWQKDVHYVFGKEPPKSWGLERLPYKQTMDYKNIFTFLNPGKDRMFQLQLISQDVNIDARSLSTTFCILDEVQNCDLSTFFEKEVRTLRQLNNINEWKQYPYFHGWHITGSMSYDFSQRQQLLSFGKYYENEFGIDYIGNWKSIVNLMLQQLEIDPRINPVDWTYFENKILELARINIPRVSKDGYCFILTNAKLANPFINYMEYFYNEYHNTLSPLMFRTEVLNDIIDNTEDVFFHVEKKHLYKNKFNIDYIDKKEPNQLDNCFSDVYEDYYSLDLPLILSFDLGNFSCVLVSQYHAKTKTINVIKEFFIKIGQDEFINLAKKFTEYFKNHRTKKIIFCKDKHGDVRKSNTSYSKDVTTWNSDLINYFKKNGFEVEIRTHAGQEPSAHESLLLMNKIFSETNPEKYPKIRINENNCPSLLMSLKYAKIKEVGDKIIIDKSSESNKSIKQEWSTHFADNLKKMIEIVAKNIITGVRTKVPGMKF